MGKKKLTSIIAVILLAIIIFFVSWSNSRNGFNSGTFKLAIYNFSDLNPVTAQTRNEWNIFYLTQSQLVRFYGDKIDYDAADSFQTNDDYTKYTFHIREGLKWSNGDTLDANDFLYGVYTMMSPDIASPRAGSFTEIKNASNFASGKITDFNEVGVKVLDNQTIEFTLEYPITDFEKSIASKHIYPINKNFYESVGAQSYGSNIESLLCSGPYVISEWQLGSNLSLVKNLDYWDANDNFWVETIELIPVENGSTAVMMYENDEVDAIMNLDNEYYASFNDEMEDGYSGKVKVLWLNGYGKNEKVAKLFANRNFRQAINSAINRQEIVDLIDSADIPMNRAIAPIFEVNYEPSTISVTGDEELAQEYLDKALKELGYKNASELPKIRFVTYADDSQKTECELLIETWRKVLGIKNIELESYNVGTAIDKLFTGDYDIFSIQIESNVRPTDLMESLSKDNVYDFGILKNDTFDSLIKNAIKATDDKEKEELTKEAEQEFLDDGTILPLYFDVFRSAVKKYVSGYKLGFIDGFEFQKLRINKSE
ncbi:peptide ABC transporter substrate-binding protein [Candidatus Saccharibacteria bacterium]|nr:peptide ABC transporter substrate-binding protein [Candidatus Saccharibacteria bacterium]